MNTSVLKSNQLEDLRTFCVIYNREMSAHSAAETIWMLKDENPKMASVIADVCDVDLEDVCLSTIMTTPMLKICFLLYRKCEAGLLDKMDLRNLVSVIDEVKHEDLAKPLNMYLAELMNDLIYNQWHRLTTEKHKLGMHATTSDEWLGWRDGNKTNRDPDGTKHMVYALLGMHVSLLKHYVTTPQTALKESNHE